MTGLLDRALRESDYAAKREQFARENPGRAQKKGIGFAAFFHGAGFTGSGEEYLASVVEAEATAEGRVRIMAASTEIGQGTNTIFSQIAADALGIPYDQIEIAQPDTAAVPNSGPTVASRTSMIVGKLVESAAIGIKQSLVAANLLSAAGAYTPEEFARACREYIAARGPLRARVQYHAPPGIKWDDKTYIGDAYGAYAWAVYVAEVTVDTATFETRVDDFVALQEVGKVIHPVLAAGQIEGGVAQAIGFALYENVVWQHGRMANGQMTNYIMPTAADLPRIRVFFEETPYAYGPAARRESANCPWMAARRPLSARLRMPPASCCAKFPSCPRRLMEAIEEKAGTRV